MPYALFALPAGVASDRFNRKWLMIWADVVRMLALGSLGVGFVQVVTICARMVPR